MRELSITVATTTTADTLLAELAAGTASLHTERSNGTFRKVHFLAAGTEDRELAEYVVALREGNEEDGRNPRTMAQIATELHTSIPSIRRMINDLLMTIELEEMDAAELDELLNGGQEVEDNMVVTEDTDTDSE